MMEILKRDRIKLAVALLLTAAVTLLGFVLLFYFFNHIHNSRFGDDFGAHFLIGLGESLNWPNDPPHWLFFQLVRKAYHASGSRVFAYNVFIGTAAAATIFKYLFFVFHKGLFSTSQKESWLNPQRHILAIGLLLCAVVPVVSGFGESTFLGYISPTCWRSTTTIVSIPLAILLFYGTSRMFEQLQGSSWYLVIYLMILEVVLVQVKPSYMLAYLPAISLIGLSFLLSGKIDRNELIKYILIVLVGTLALAERKISLGASDTGALQILPFKVWLNFVDGSVIKLIAALISSIALPLIYLAECKWKGHKSGLLFNFAFLVLAVAIVQYLIFAETGEYALYRNLIWQSMTASTIIHMVIVQRSYEKNYFFTLGYFVIEVLVGLNWVRLLTLG